MNSYKRIDEVNYVVLIGNVQPTSLENFMDEYFHPDHNEDEEEKRHCVLMQHFGPEKVPEL